MEDWYQSLVAQRELSPGNFSVTGHSYLTKAGNQFDVVGDTTPSVVGNSLFHIGTDVRVFIEDQPLARPGVKALDRAYALAKLEQIIDGQWVGAEHFFAADEEVANA